MGTLFWDDPFRGGNKEINYFTSQDPHLKGLLEANLQPHRHPKVNPCKSLKDAHAMAKGLSLTTKAKQSGVDSSIATLAVAARRLPVAWRFPSPRPFNVIALAAVGGDKGPTELYIL